MSWVLILTPAHNARIKGAPPAIIGGYRSKEEATAAGEAAIDPFRGDPELRAEFDRELEEYSTATYPLCDWESYVVIPGAADTPPESA